MDPFLELFTPSLPVSTLPGANSTVKDFLDGAYAAQEDNKKRVRIVRRAKKSRAKAGIYLRGPRAPYGFRHQPMEWDAHGNPTHYKLVPDVGPYVERGFPQAATFAPNPYEARRRMIRLYAEGHSPRRIREMLLASGVPTATMLTPRAGSPGEWYPETVRMLVNNPLNEGKLYNFRHRNVAKDPDDHHEDEWTQQAPVPLDKQIRSHAQVWRAGPADGCDHREPARSPTGQRQGVEPTVVRVVLRGVCVAGDRTWPLCLRR